jgi:DnaK suppressor protein
VSRTNKELEAERARLSARIEELEGELAEVISAIDSRTAPDPDSSDAGSGDVERDRVTALLAAARANLVELEAAAHRFAAGKGGVCAKCGKQISAERQAALPTATMCTDCARPNLRSRLRR